MLGLSVCDREGAARAGLVSFRAVGAEVCVCVRLYLRLQVNVGREIEWKTWDVVPSP